MGMEPISDGDKQIRELFRQKHAEEWNPIVVELPWFGKDEEPRKVIEGIVKVFAACGFELGNILTLRLDEGLVKEGLALAASVDSFRKRTNEIMREKIGDPHNILLEDVFRAGKEEGQTWNERG